MSACPGTDPRSVLPVADVEAPTTPTLDVRDLDQPPMTLPGAPKDAPNVVVILIDDMGFGATSAFGGPCRTPTAERLAAGGLRFNRFHTTALCSPTRQSLMTGRNHHAVNMGTITNMATPVPGYTSVRPNTAATLAEVLRLNGYNTGAFGKMHQTPAWEVTPVGPFDRWPTGEGFERFYGFMSGEMDHWSPLLYDGTTPVEAPADPDYHLSEDLTTKAIDWVRQQQALAADKPFLLYLSYGATHAPHHAPREWIERYRGRFDQGWDRVREETLARQKEIGVVPADCELTPRHEEIPAWDDLSASERLVAARLMEAYAGFTEHTDHQVGRLVDALDEADALDNTIFLYILGDNGASAEGGIAGAVNEIASLNGIHDSTDNLLAVLDEIGGPSTYNHYPAGWAHAMNTPYQWTKQVASHWGGTRVGMVLHWPDGTPRTGESRDQWQHVIDVYPTILEAAGLPVPTHVNGVPQQRVDGTSFLASVRDASAAENRTTQYFEMFGNRGIYHEGWMACTKHSTPWDHDTSHLPSFGEDVWELYGPDDWSQRHDLAEQEPARLAELQALFLAEAERNHVLPLDDRKAERFTSDIARRPSVLGGRRSVELFPGMTRLPDAAFPNVRNKSHEVTARITVPDEGCAGAIVAQGARFGGWSFHVRGGRLVYSHNWMGRDLQEVVATEPLAPGEHVVAFGFEYDAGAGFGGGGEVDLRCDGRSVGTGTVARTVPFHYGPTCADVGCDNGSGVVPDYETPRATFTGTIDSVIVSIEPAVTSDVPEEVEDRIEMATQ
ncbi:arylsulfatase [Nocardioides albidus]|uniref:Arylsulfatase n=1 Tax=Nocardioides albidus TaxID=1517589 RepID=A0A5C4VYX9_9ACTN|nr:arylsulfatase [Nocardioides albidus]TNM41182.1 arylsulfatase [Nocardioides albidus]